MITQSESRRQLIICVASVWYVSVCVAWCTANYRSVPTAVLQPSSAAQGSAALAGPVVGCQMLLGRYAWLVKQPVSYVYLVVSLAASGRLTDA